MLKALVHNIIVTPVNTARWYRGSILASHHLTGTTVLFHITNRGVDPFFGLGGGGKSKENVKKKSARLCAQIRNIKLCAKFLFFVLFVCVCVCFYVKFNGFVVPESAFLNLFLHFILLIFQVAKIIGGGGGGQRYVCPPNIFIGGAAAPLAPQDRRLWSQMMFASYWYPFIHLVGEQ